MTALQMDRNTKSRELYIDYAKGIAILCVILGHIIGGLEDAGLHNKLFYNLNVMIYCFHMPLMFICSGYLEGYSDIRAKYNSFGKYCWHNIKALYVPYLIFAYAFWAVKFFIFEGNNKVTLSGLFTNIYSGYMSFWFLLALLLIKVIHGLFEYFKIKVYINILFWTIIFMTNIIFLRYGGGIEVLYWLYWGIFYSIGFYMNKNRFLDKKYIVLIGSFIFLAIGLMIPGGFETIHKKFFIGTAVSVMILFLSYKMKLRNKIIIYAGRNSMVFYLFHLFLTPGLRVLLMHCQVKTYMMYIVVEFLGSIVACIILIELFTKVKFLGWIQYLFYPCRMKK